MRDIQNFEISNGGKHWNKFPTVGMSSFMGRQLFLNFASQIIV